MRHPHSTVSLSPKWDDGKENGNYYKGYDGESSNGKENTTWNGHRGFREVILGLSLGCYPPIMENQMEKQMEHEMETGVLGFRDQLD